MHSDVVQYLLYKSFDGLTILEYIYLAEYHDQKKLATIVQFNQVLISVNLIEYPYFLMFVFFLSFFSFWYLGVFKFVYELDSSVEMVSTITFTGRAGVTALDKATSFFIPVLATPLTRISSTITERSLMQKPNSVLYLQYCNISL